jgi:hypothetical protein
VTSIGVVPGAAENDTLTVSLLLVLVLLLLPLAPLLTLPVFAFW